MASESPVLFRVAVALDGIPDAVRHVRPLVAALAGTTALLLLFLLARVHESVPPFFLACLGAL